jgi:alpha-1,2-mannosyltransferase
LYPGDALSRARTRAVTWIVTGFLVLLAAAYLAHLARGNGLDLRVYRAGIGSWRSGHNPYLGAFTIHHLHFTYPPFALLALSPLTWAPFAATQIALWTLSITALTGAVYVVCLRCGRAGGWLLFFQSLGWASLSVVVVEPVRSNLNYDQINTLLMGLIVVDLLVLPRRHRGWLVGLAAAIKLTPLIFLAIPLLERDWKAAGRSAGAAAGATGLAWLLYPDGSWTYWTKDVFDARRVGGVAYAGNQSLYGDLHRWPFASGGNSVIWVAMSAATLVMGAYVSKRCLSDNRRVAAVLSLAFVGLEISPVSWTHHWVWVALVPPVLMVDRRQVPGLSPRIALWALFAVSVLGPYWWFTSGVGQECLGDSLSLCALVTLAVWSWSEYKNRDDGAPRILSQTGRLQGPSLPTANTSNWNN